MNNGRVAELDATLCMAVGSGFDTRRLTGFLCTRDTRDRMDYRVSNQSHLAHLIHNSEGAESCHNLMGKRPSSTVRDAGIEKRTSSGATRMRRERPDDRQSTSLATLSLYHLATGCSARGFLARSARPQEPISRRFSSQTERGSTSTRLTTGVSHIETLNSWPFCRFSITPNGNRSSSNQTARRRRGVSRPTLGERSMKIDWKRCPACKGERFLMRILNGDRRHMICPCCGGDGCIAANIPNVFDKLINRIFPEVK